MPISIGLILAAVCVTLSIYSTDALHTCSTTNSLRLYNPNGNTTTEGGMLQICLSGIWRAACDYSFHCTTNGRAACRQLGYSGSQISMCMNVSLYLTLVVHTVIIVKQYLYCWLSGKMSLPRSTCVNGCMKNSIL